MKLLTGIGMTYYQTQVASLSRALYSNTYLLKQIIQARHFIDCSYANRLTLDDICLDACISKFHLLRSFRRIYGITPYQYLTYVRISRAKELLKSGRSVEDTSFSIGFESSTSFAKFFKKAVALSPASYQKSLMRRPR